MFIFDKSKQDKIHLVQEN